MRNRLQEDRGGTDAGDVRRDICPINSRFAHPEELKRKLQSEARLRLVVGKKCCVIKSKTLLRGAGGCQEHLKGQLCFIITLVLFLLVLAIPFIISAS